MGERDWADVLWSKDGIPYAPRFLDSYFGENDIAAEAEHVFCKGLGLPSAWDNFWGGCVISTPVQIFPTQAFRIVELGFGAGVNFLQTCRLWHCWQKKQSGNLSTMRTLDYCAIEKHPMRVEDFQRTHIKSQIFGASRLLAYWEELEKNQGATYFCWQISSSLRLTLLLGEAHVMLERIADRKVDGWYLDGFAPRDNSSMWSEKIFAHIARCTRSRSRIDESGTAGENVPQLASFSVARSVRERAEAYGFHTRKRVGLGKKREVLQGFFVNTLAG